MVTENNIDRRQFLKTATAIAVGTIAFPYVVPSSALGKAGCVAPSNRITMGCIGVGGQGTHNMRGFLENMDVQVVAVCDVELGSREYPAHLAGRNLGREPARNIVDEFYARRKPTGIYASCAAYQDFRQLLARDDIDVISNATPDHWHVPISIAAAKAGKDIYCEKPLTLTIAEGRALCNVVKKYGRVFQTGSQYHSSARIRFACELVRNGRIGKLRTIRVQIPANNVANPISWQVMPVPKGFDYEMWLGPALWQPYTRLRCHYSFRFILDYSGGQITNFGAHFLDIAQWGNGTQYTGPVEIKGCGQFPKTGLFSTATKANVEYTYANGVKLFCTTGGSSLRFEGTDGWLQVDWQGGTLLNACPKSLLESKIGPDEIRLYKSKDHKRNFLDCVKLRETPAATAEIGHRSATVCHLGNIAMQLGRKLKWNPEKERFADDPIANAMIARSMRAPWNL